MLCRYLGTWFFFLCFSVLADFGFNFLDREFDYWGFLSRKKVENAGTVGPILVKFVLVPNPKIT